MFVFQRKINNKDALIIQNGEGSIPRAGAEVVAVYVNDDGNFTYIAGTWDGQDIIPGEQPSSLPEVTPSDEGKVLTVDSEGEWVAGNAGSSLPPVTQADAGKVLIVDSEGNWTVGNPPSDLDQLMQEEF